jgi:hypothetical protein
MLHFYISIDRLLHSKIWHPWRYSPGDRRWLQQVHSSIGQRHVPNYTAQNAESDAKIGKILYYCTTNGDISHLTQCINPF